MRSADLFTPVTDDEAFVRYKLSVTSAFNYIYRNEKFKNRRPEIDLDKFISIFLVECNKQHVKDVILMGRDYEKVAVVARINKAYGDGLDMVRFTYDHTVSKLASDRHFHTSTSGIAFVNSCSELMEFFRFERSLIDDKFDKNCTLSVHHEIRYFIDQRRNRVFSAPYIPMFSTPMLIR